MGLEDLGGLVAEGAVTPGIIGRLVGGVRDRGDRWRFIKASRLYTIFVPPGVVP